MENKTRRYALLLLTVTLLGVYMWALHFADNLSAGTRNTPSANASVRSTASSNFDNSACSPHLHVYYLKVPKTGSSTFSNILNRKAFIMNLTQSKLRKLCPQQFPDRKRIEFQSQDHFRFDILSHHSSYNRPNILQAMHEDTSFVATIRHPFNNFRSKYFFYQNRLHLYGKVDLKGDPIETLLNKSVYDAKLHTFRLKGNKTLAGLENTMYKYFKYDPQQAMTSETYLKHSLEAIENEFPLIIINEHFDESLVLLKRMLCWTMKDILHVWHKNATFVNKKKRPEEYGDLYARHRNISSLDYRLYEHFLNVHRQKVLAAGSSFIEEVKEFKRVKEAVNKFCSKIYNDILSENKQKQMNVTLNQQIFFSAGPFHGELTVSGDYCILMALEQHVFMHAIGSKNYDMYCSTKRPQTEKSDQMVRTDTVGFIYQYIPYDKLKGHLLKDMQLHYQS